MPPIVCAAVLVMKSEPLIPVSSEKATVAMVVVGATLSMVKGWARTAPSLPAASVTFTRIVPLPDSITPASCQLFWPAVAVAAAQVAPPSSDRRTVSPTARSADSVPLIVCDAVRVTKSPLPPPLAAVSDDRAREAMAASGAVVSSRMVNGPPSRPTTPPALLSRAVRVLVPSPPRSPLVTISWTKPSAMSCAVSVRMVGWPSGPPSSSSSTRSPTAALLPSRLTRKVGVVRFVGALVSTTPPPLPIWTLPGASVTVTAPSWVPTQPPLSATSIRKTVVPDDPSVASALLRGAKTRARRSACAAAPMLATAVA